VDIAAAAALVTHCAARLDGKPLAVADRPGTPVAILLDDIAEPSARDVQRYYVRIPDRRGSSTPCGRYLTLG